MCQQFWRGIWYIDMEFLQQYLVMDDDRERFEEAVRLALDRFDKYKENPGGIGTLSEKTIHAALKNYFADEEYQEVKLEGFVADALTPDGVFEIQTRQFYTQKRKLEAFLPKHKVCMVYPVRYRRVINWISPDTGEISKGRKSPKIDRGYGIFYELIGIKDYLLHENLTFCIMYFNSDEYKYLDGFGENKKIRATRADGVPTELIAEVNLCAPEDYMLFVPEELKTDNKEFNSLSFSKLAKIDRNTARVTLLVLKHLGVVMQTGRLKSGNIYRVNFEYLQ